MIHGFISGGMATALAPTSLRGRRRVFASPRRLGLG
jgi:hypothetical protein